MFCTNCGKEINSDKKYCPFCGVENSGYKIDENLNEEKRSVKSTAEKTAGKAIRTKVIAGAAGCAILGGCAFGGYNVYSHYIEKKQQKVTGSSSDVKKNKTKESTKEVEKFTLKKEQITQIERAARLYDEIKRNDDIYARKDYSLSLEQKEIPTNILENVMAGILCDDDSIGNIVQETESGERTESIDADKCKELLKDTFGYNVKSDSDLQNIFTVNKNNELDFTHLLSEATEDNYIQVCYDAKKFVQTAEDTYHFYIYVSSEYQSGQLYTSEGWMDITAHKNEKSLFGGFVFEKIEFKLDPDGTTDYERIINDMVSAKAEVSGDTAYNPTGIYEINKLTDEEFERYAQKFVTNAECCEEYRTAVSGSSTTSTLSENVYEDICKNTLGREISNDEGANTDHIWVYADEADMWFEIVEDQIFQSLDGTIEINGIIQNSKSDRETKYNFTANGYANKTSKTGMIIEKVEVTEDPTTAWKDAYISWIENSNGNATYVLIDVNGDEIPELVRVGANMAEGETVATYANGEVQEVQIYRMGIKYVPSGNVIDNSSGSMGEYYDQIYKIEDGKWVQIADGKYGVEDNTLPPEYDEEGNLIYDYFEWNGNIVSESEYKNYVNTILGNDNVETVSEDGVSSTRIIGLINED